MPGPTLIQIKRSLNTAAPGALANGEFGYTANGDVLYIGSNSTLVPIGGKRVPGVLTANQAIVTNATNMIDKIMLGNSTVNAVANSLSLTLANSTVTFSVTKPTAAQVSDAQYFLGSDGIWKHVTGATANPGGSNTDIQYNNSGSMDGSDAFTFNNTTNTVNLVNALAVGANVLLDTTHLAVGNSTVNAWANSLLLQVSDTTGVANLKPTSLVIGTSTVNSTVHAAGANVILGTVDLRIGNSTVNSVANSLGLVLSNSTVTFTIAKPTAGQVSSADYYLASDSTWKQVTVSSTLDSLTDVTITSVANNNLLVYNGVDSQWENIAAGNGFNFVSGSIPVVKAANGIVVNTTGVAVGLGNGIGTNTTTTFVVPNNGIVSNTTGVWAKAANGISVDSSGINVLGGSTLTVNTSGVHVNSTLSIQDLTLGGNLTVTGTLVTVDATNIQTKDSLISLADQQANTVSDTDALDIGFYGQWGNTLHTKFGGLFRDASNSGVFTLFAGEIPVPTTTIDTSNVNYALANLVIGSLTLGNPLTGPNGGTGRSSFTDQDILVANTTNGFNKLGLGTTGLILQSNGSALLYDTLDGGTF